MNTATNTGKFSRLLEKQFQLKERNTNVRTEFIAGLTTFLTCTYIIAINPAILSAAGMDAKAVFRSAERRVGKEC